MLVEDFTQTPIPLELPPAASNMLFLSGAAIFVLFPAASTVFAQGIGQGKSYRSRSRKERKIYNMQIKS